METKTSKEIVSKMPSWAIGAIAIAGTALVVASLIIGYKLIKRALKKNASKDLEKEAKKEINKDKLSFTSSEYQSMADRLFRAMDGAGTDWDVVKSVINKLKVKDDWLALISAYGIKETTSWVSTFKGNLVEWLSDELSASEYKTISDQLKTIGVTI